jgi:hypothetical protein
VSTVDFAVHQSVHQLAPNRASGVLYARTGVRKSPGGVLLPDPYSTVGCGDLRCSQGLLPVGFQNSAVVADLRFQAAGSYPAFE